MNITLTAAIEHNLDLLIAQGETFSIFNVTKLIRKDLESRKYTIDSINYINHSDVKNTFHEVIPTMDPIYKGQNLKIDTLTNDKGQVFRKYTPIDANLVLDAPTDIDDHNNATKDKCNRNCCDAVCTDVVEDCDKCDEVCVKPKRPFLFSWFGSK